MKIKKVIVKKILTDDEMSHITKSPHSSYDTFYSVKNIKKLFKTGNVDCYWIDEYGNKRILFKIRRKVIPKDIADKTYEIYEKYVNVDKNTNSNFSDVRVVKYYDKTNDKTIKLTAFRNTRSKVSGYYDKIHIALRQYFKGTNTVCRKTAFTRDNWDKWESVIPFFEIIANQYKQLAPKHYKRQLALFDSPVTSKFQIGNTPFTTITSNYNWRTAIHKDKGDYREGMGNLTVLGGEFHGGYLCFPQFGVAVDVRPRDTVIMDVHQWHCNTELKTNNTNRVRLSFVSYFREKIADCNSKKIVNDEELYYHNKNTKII